MSYSSLIFLDRDGVLNDLVIDSSSGAPESPYRPEDVRLMPHAVPGLRVLAGLGVPLVVVSNQPSAAKGKATPAELRAVHLEVERLLGIEDVGKAIVSYRYCFHYPGGGDPELGVACDCRKPASGMLLAAASDLGVADLARSWVIGDSDVDVLAGRAAGCRTILIEEPASAHRRGSGIAADVTCANLLEAANAVATVHASRRVLA
jgi:D-glycero-D-manno-heptose 1,7-bisphosphate phosphatase